MPIYCVYIQYQVFSVQPSLLTSAEAIHPSLWRASQLARSHGTCVETGYPSLSAELPGGGWPAGVLIELLLQQSGTAEFSLLRPALSRLDGRRIVLLQPPYQPQALALHGFGLHPAQFLWLRCAKPGDALWAAEQVLRAGSCGALLLWQQQIRNEALRRLHLAAQSSDTLFYMVRPLSCARDPSPAALRLALTPVSQGLQVHLVKRRGARRDMPLLLSMSPLTHLSDHAFVDRLTPAFAASGSVSSELVGG